MRGGVSRQFFLIKIWPFLTPPCQISVLQAAGFIIQETFSGVSNPSENFQDYQEESIHIKPSNQGACQVNL